MIVTDEGEVIQVPRSALGELRACFKKSNEHHLVTLKTWIVEHLLSLTDEHRRYTALDSFSYSNRSHGKRSHRMTCITLWMSHMCSSFIRSMCLIRHLMTVCNGEAETVLLNSLVWYIFVMILSLACDYSCSVTSRMQRCRRCIFFVQASIGPYLTEYCNRNVNSSEC